MAQINMQAKSNEITAIPELLNLLDLKGAIVTMDAMECQKSLVKKIVKEKKADYLIGLKGNQGIMHLMGFVAEFSFIFLAAKITGCLRRNQAINSWLDRTLGSILIALGIRLAFAERT